MMNVLNMYPQERGNVLDKAQDAVINSLHDWLKVPGDIEDFVYYWDDEARHSDK